MPPACRLLKEGGVSKAYTGRSRVRLSKALQETLLANLGLLQSPKIQSRSSGNLPQDVFPPSKKRLLDATFDSDPLPAKRARLTGTYGQQALHQPKPKPSNSSYASFLQDFVDPIHPEPPRTSVHCLVAEWLESVDSDRTTCRSDSHLYYSHSDPISRRLTKSAPVMSSVKDVEETSSVKDADRFTLPTAPASAFSRSNRTQTDDSSSIANVRHPSYRRDNLESNNIRILRSVIQLPIHISGHLCEMGKGEDSPDPSSEKLQGYMQELSFLADGCTEADVECFLADAVFPNALDPTYGRSSGLEIAKSALMSSHLIPNNPDTPFRVTQPKPDVLYGYCNNIAFTEAQRQAQSSLYPRSARFAVATAQGLRFPFFTVEFKAAGGTRGDLWVAVNQCAGASSACLSIIARLNEALRKSGSKQRVDNVSYSVAVDNNTAQLYVAWKGDDDPKYHLQQVGTFVLSREEEFKSFRRQVRDIVHWGMGTRLAQIRDAMDSICEEKGKKATEHAKAHQPSDVGRSGSKKRTYSQSRRNSSVSSSAETRSWAPNESEDQVE
ncbi:hypothetical protein F4802DRAFT_109555 [Xylaria palmicola]|nr:hypothetical protein F4802DRAFT_109555 [Xylaria palmicola]